MSPDEYLAFERDAAAKHEYWQGELFAVAGKSRRHNLLVANLLRSLGNALLHGPCEVYPSDMRVSATAGDVFTYPDVTVVCGEPKFRGSEQETLLDPSVIIEVLSDSTDAHDRGRAGSHAAPQRRGEHYRAMASVHDYLLVAQNQILVEHFSRQPDGTWSHADHRIGDTITLTVCDLVVADIYLKVLEHDAT